MRKAFTCAGLVAVVAAAGLAGRAMSQDAPPGAEDMQKYMAEWMKMNAPGPEHKKLEMFVGDWDVTSSMGGQPAGKGSATFRLVLGGRWLQQEYKGAMQMGPAAMPYDGLGLLGFDRVRGRYMQVWLDSMGTAAHVGTGFFDQTGKVAQFFGEMDEPQMKVWGKTFKWVIRQKDDDHFGFEIHDMHIGETNTKVVELQYSRKTK